MLMVIFSEWHVSATGQGLPMPEKTKSAFTLQTRSTSGLPGKSYWQNRGDYTIKVSFDPLSRKISGSVMIVYTNNSPDTLKMLVFKIFPNLYKDETMRNIAVDAGDLGKGMNIERLSINGKMQEEQSRPIKGTNMYLKGVCIVPKTIVSIDIDYSYILNKGSFVRTGQIDTGSFFVAYFFPRIAVYDDIDGWDQFAYRGKEEFYNDYGNFHAEISVPAQYQVWATGELKNTTEVYQPEIAERISRAEQSDSVIHVVTPADIKDKKVTLGKLQNTWKFQAVDVSDFAFAISDHYIWNARSVMVDSLSKRCSRIDAVFNAEHSSFAPVLQYAAKTVELISHYFPAVPFPYSHQTMIEGLDAMEYPMLVNLLPFKEHNTLLELTTHEVFHSLFPFYVGTDETRYSFLDEGWATFSEFYLSPMVDNSVPLDYSIEDVNQSAGIAEDVPIMTPTPQLYGKARYANKDLKPALALRYLKEEMGEQRFIAATHYFIKNWAGKHPTPYDFFNCMEKGSGLDLNWYWKNWYFEKNIPDLGLKNITRKKLNYRITISSTGTLAVPIHLKITFFDGSNQTINKSVSCWKDGRRDIIINIKAKSPIKVIELGDGFDADADPSNNKWISN